MSTLLIKNIGLLRGIGDSVTALRGASMDHVESLEDAYITARDGVIDRFGKMEACPEPDGFDSVIDAFRGIVTSTFCDSHTHLVYAGSRQREFIDKINGLSYEEIARRGGGILNSSDRVARVSEDELYDSARRRLLQIAANGTGAVEIKSGYGLTLESELKMLQVIDRLRRDFPMIEIRATFLGAHAVGRDFAGRQGDYVDHIINEMLPEVAHLAQFVDVFCDEGFFTPEETSDILEAASRFGLRPKIHANELAVSGGVQTGVRANALSVDHLERIGDEEIELLASSSTVATMLPGASFFLGMPYAPARKAIDKGCAVALASDWNPGSSPSGSMPFVMSLGCIKMKLTPDRAFNAVTINGAAAMGLADMYGSIACGKAASLIIYNPWVPDPDYIPYAYSEPLINKVILKGQLL
ncbi:MAG: imidazolonepropionase [Odoribacter sp.]|nr:imidazolonepropionase [Odoribacter sp.]